MMRLLQRFWRDNSVSNVSSAVLATGILGVLFASLSIGVGFAADDSPISELARMLRQLDQSFSVPRREAGDSWTASSEFKDSNPAPTTIQQVGAQEVELQEVQPKPPATVEPVPVTPAASAKMLPRPDTTQGRFSRKWFKPTKETPDNGQPIFESTTFYHAEPSVIVGETTIALIQVTLAVSAEVHLRANTTMVALAPDQTVATRFLAESPKSSDGWIESTRIVTLPAPRQHVNVNLVHAIRLDAGEYTIQWVARPATPDGRVAVHAGGALLLQALPVE